MDISTTKAHPTGNGRSIVKTYRITSVGASASGEGNVKRPDVVTIMAKANDGVDSSVSSRVFITIGINDDPGQIDDLIKRLTDLRARQVEDAPTEIESQLKCKV